MRTPLGELIKVGESPSLRRHHRTEPAARGGIAFWAGVLSQRRDGPRGRRYTAPRQPAAAALMLKGYSQSTYP